VAKRARFRDARCRRWRFLFLREGGTKSGLAPDFDLVSTRVEVKDYDEGKICCLVYFR
jgi:hypothetical protein